MYLYIDNFTEKKSEEFFISSPLTSQRSALPPQIRYFSSSLYSAGYRIKVVWVSIFGAPLLFLLSVFCLVNPMAERHVSLPGRSSFEVHTSNRLFESKDGSPEITRLDAFDCSDVLIHKRGKTAKQQSTFSKKISEYFIRSF